ncbi:MAG: thioredoxin-disulfide reductase [Nitrospinae bacterium]|nr:thioredoxin-disulfide reductase [Nitrospinota bacterium]
METFDLVIIGGGPGGLSAAIYAIRAKMNVVIIEKTGLGGQIAVTDIIENYLGFPSLSGADLVGHFETHVKSLGVPVKYALVEKITKEDGLFILSLGNEKVGAKSVIVGSGAEPSKLKIPGELEFTGRGVSTCATCDGPFYRGRDIAIVGGGDTAVKEAIYLSRLVKKIYLVHRRDSFRAEKILQERVLARPNVEFLWFHKAVEVKGDQSGVTALEVQDVRTEAVRALEVHGVFIFVGIVPNTAFVDCDKDAAGFIKTNEKMETSVPGLYAIGDCRVTPLRQVAVSVGEGAIAAVSAGDYVSELEGTAYAGKAKSK